MESEFIKTIKEWLDTPTESRDNSKGALLMLKCTRNKIMFNNMSMRPDYYATHIEYQIRKYLEQHNVVVTHEAVTTMEKQSESIISAIGEKDSTTASEYRKGKRADHDSLPVEIQQLYTDNLTILHRMRECHLQVRQCSGPNQACVDNDKYPFLKELIALDKKRLANWKTYDSYNVATASTAVATVSESDAKLSSQVRLNLGKYIKNPTDAKKKYIAGLYSQIVNPAESLTTKLKDAGIIDA